MKGKGKIIIFIVLILLTCFLGYNLISKKSHQQIKILNAKEQLSIGNSLKLEAKIKNAVDGKIVWISSDSEVLQIDQNGVLIAKSLGTSKITLMYIRKNNQKITDSVDITVSQGDINIMPTSISFSSNLIGIKVNKDYKLPLTIKPTNAYLSDIVYSSSDINNLIVSSDGTINALNDGLYEIKLIAGNNRFTDTIKVIVSSKYDEPTLMTEPNDLIFDELETKVYLDDIVNLDYVLEPANASLAAVNWQSSDSGVLIVNDGIVRGLKVGKSVVSATLPNGKTTKIAIQVLEKEIPVTKIKLIPGSLLLKVGSSQTVVTQTYPNNAENKEIKYEVSDSSVVSIDKYGKVIALKEGSAIISAIVNEKVRETMIVNVVNDSLYNENIDNVNQNSNEIALVLKSSTGILRGSYANLIKGTQKTTIGISSIKTVNGVGKVEYCLYQYGQSECNNFITINDINNDFYVADSVGEKVIRMKITDNKGQIIYKDYYLSISTLTDNIVVPPSGDGSSCGKVAQTLVAYINGKQIERYEKFTISVGETMVVKLYLPRQCGNIKLLTRTTADGEEGWRTYLDGSSNPFVDRYNSATFQPRDNFEWIIIGKKQSNGRYIHLSQTTFQSTDKFDEIKSFFNVYVKVIG